MNDLPVTNAVIAALDKLKSIKGFKSNYALAQHYKISQSTVGDWYNKPSISISTKTLGKIGNDLLPLIDETVSGDPDTLRILDGYIEEDTDFAIAHMARRLGGLTNLVPAKLESLTDKKRDALRKILEGLSELVD